MRAAIEGAVFANYQGDPFKITASFGVTAVPADKVKDLDLNAFTRLADQALYRAKSEGRNCVFRGSMLD